jgi:dsRNA-specific ribonuclease
MKNYDIMVITSKVQFDSIFNDFKESAKISSNPHIYMIGLDIECISKDNNKSFDKCLQWVNQADTIASCKLQIASKTHCLVIDLCKFEKILPENLIKILTSESWIKTGVGISKDLDTLSYNFLLGQCNGAIDVKTYASIYGINNPNLADLYKSVTGISVNKNIHKEKNKYENRIRNVSNNNINSNNNIKNENIDIANNINMGNQNEEYIICDWSKSLTIEQIEYASMDAIMSYKLGSILIEGLVGSFKKFKEIIPTQQKSDQSDITLSQPLKMKLLSSNYIGDLQEIAQKKKITLPEYVFSKSTETNYNFKVLCNFDLKTTCGFGMTKKDAKANAAKNMLDLLK